MKIAVIGAGISGLATAYELQRDGHDVVVFERHASVAQEGSFASAGHIAPSMLHPLAFAAQSPASWVKKMVRTSGISAGLGLSASDLRWLYGWKMGQSNFPQALAAAHALLKYSQHRLAEVTKEQAFVFEQSQGNLVLWKTQGLIQACTAQLEVLKGCGLTVQTLTPDQARTVEPALHPDYAFAGAMYFGSDCVANCREVAHLLKASLVRVGVTVQFDTEVTRVESDKGVVLYTSAGETCAADHVVVCTAGGNNALGLGEAWPSTTTVWSYSLSVPVREPLNAPRSAVQDMHSRISVSRLGMRVRVSGGAELGSGKRGNAPVTVNALYRTLSALFPGATDFSQSALLWRGASQFTRDGLPFLGQSLKPGVWLNLGHGHNGWGMALGCARLITDMVSNRDTDIDATKLRPERFRT